MQSFGSLIKKKKKGLKHTLDGHVMSPGLTYSSHCPPTLFLYSSVSKATALASKATGDGHWFVKWAVSSCLERKSLFFSTVLFKNKKKLSLRPSSSTAHTEGNSSVQQQQLPSVLSMGYCIYPYVSLAKLDWTAVKPQPPVINYSKTKKAHSAFWWQRKTFSAFC